MLGFVMTIIDQSGYSSASLGATSNLIGWSGLLQRLPFL